MKSIKLLRRQKIKKSKLSKLIVALIAIASLATTATAQVSKETLDSITTPDKVKTSIGTMKFLDGAPYPETAETAYDYLDTMRGVDAYLKGMPLASIYGLVEGAHSQGAVEAHQIILFEQMLDSQPIYLTGNTSTFYVLKELDLERDGATVIELPAGLLGAINDAWFRYLADFGPFGQDKGKGGKYVILPPGYEGEIPEGHFVVRSDSYRHWIFLRASIADGVDKAVKLIKDNLRIYPLAKADNPPAMEFINRSGKSYNTVHANNFKFYEELNNVIQKEPLELLDAETRGLFASIGIVKGKPFAPDARMKKILTDAVAIGNATARSIVWYPRTDGTMKGIEVYPGADSAWQMGWVDKNVFFNGKDGHTMNSDARVMFHYPYTAVTPAMAVTIPGAGSDYAMAFVDSNKQPFDGSKTYKLNIPANPPVNNFWSVMVYDSQTRSQLRTGQRFPALDSLSGTFKKNADGSIDLYFGPRPPNGMENNWLETVPGKSFFVALRMYGPLEPWIEKTWRPGEVELVADAKGKAQAKAAAAKANKGIPESVLTPDQVETSIGTLKFLDGAPYPETAEKAYDNLDRMRGVDAFLKGMPLASMYALLEGTQSIGAEEVHQVAIFEDLMDSQSLFLTANTSTMYVIHHLDLERDGPTVIEVPAGMLGLINDAWFRYVTDIGPFGQDKGKGGKYLILPPGFEGQIPDGYFVVRSESYRHWLLLRVSIADGLDKAAKLVKDNLRLYPLAKADNPPKMEFINASGKAFNTIHANDFKFYEELNAVIQKEPLELLDAETRGLFASIGIVKGKPFNPDARMKKILTDAVAIGNAAARSIVWYPRTDGIMKGIEVYPGQNSAWIMAYLDKNVFYNGKDGKTMNSDARVMFHYPYTGVTPAMAVSIPGKGSDYGIAYVDSKKQPFDGSKTYKLNVPANPPVNDFWSVTVYDSQTRSQLQTSQPFPALDSVSGNFKKNADGSVDIYFGPRAPRGMENNWLETVPGKSFFIGFRMYGPLEPWINRSWRPSEVELVDDTKVEAQAEVNQGIPASILTPDQVETSLGTLNFLDGAPYPETAEKAYDNLDRMRGVDAFLKGIPGASIRGLVEGVEDIGAVEAHQVAVFKDMMNANQLFLTGGNSSMYIFPTFDLERDGPTVVEVPPGILGMFDDAWFRYLEDVGPLGPDKAEGGKYLLLPPGYEGEVPEGYFVVKSPSYVVWGGMRANVKAGKEAAYKNIIDHLRIYPLSKIHDQPQMEFINASERAFNTIHANDFTFYEELKRAIEKEPLEFLDAETRGLFASIGIEKGKPFAPDARMKKILTDAVAIGNATARAIVWYPRTNGTMNGIEVFPGTDSYYVGGWVDKNVYFNGKDGHTMNSDARTFFHYMATAVTPAMAVTIPGAGSDYAIAFVDSEQRPLDGAKTYKVHLPPNVPVGDFWSITLFDSQTRSMLKSDQEYPSIQSFDNQLKANADGSYDIYFAPEPPEGMETNWIQTVPGRSWFSALRIYSPLEPWIDKTWRPSEIEMVK